MIEALVSDLRQGQRRALAKAITLIESQRADHRSKADLLLETLMPFTGNATRIGISGPPGVGKSHFIDTFGSLLADAGHRVAVLAVDPSSPITGGSILGDKTRMARLTVHPRSFIRPSPTGGSLGGVSRRTRESMLACEAAGFDFILIETVGVGQSEHLVAGMVDVFLMLQLPNAGDELQGIKKGILELADLIVVTKADGGNVSAAKRTQVEHQRALQLVRSGDSWQPRVLLCSSIEGSGFEQIKEAIWDFLQHQKTQGVFTKRREAQALAWFDSELGELVKERLNADPSRAQMIADLRAQVRGQTISPSRAAQRIVDFIFEKQARK